MEERKMYSCSICGFMDENKTTVLQHEDDCIEKARRDAMQKDMHNIAENGSLSDVWFEDLGMHDLFKGNPTYEYDESASDLNELDMFKIHQHVEGTITRIFKRRKSQ